jgi:serine/threonine protein kinase
VYFNPFTSSDVEIALNHRYRVGPQIALGGQGAVFKATRVAALDGSAANDLVALKVHLHASQDLRVAREITAMEQISSTGLARLIEHGYCDMGGRQTHYIAWEYVPGESLNSRLKSGPMFESDVLEVGRDVASAIAELWTHRIVHGDIKPNNIMLRDGGGAVLIDLGAARHLDQDNSPAARRPFGTVGYFSPEQARGEKQLSSASDIFSLGVVLLQSLLGHHPTSYDQAALTFGFRASACRVAASTSLLYAIDKMLSERPNFRQTPTAISGYFDRLLLRLEEARQAQAALQPSAEVA